IQQLRVLRRLPEPHVDHDLLEARHLVRVAVAEPLDQPVADPLLVMPLQSRLHAHHFAPLTAPAWGSRCRSGPRSAPWSRPLLSACAPASAPPSSDRSASRSTRGSAP